MACWGWLDPSALEFTLASLKSLPCLQRAFVLGAEAQSSSAIRQEVDASGDVLRPQSVWLGSQTPGVAPNVPNPEARGRTSNGDYCLLIADNRLVAAKEKKP